MNIEDDLLDSFFIRPKPKRIIERILLDGRKAIIASNLIAGVYIGSEISFDGGELPDGRYTMIDGKTRFEVTDSVITHEYYVETFKMRNNIIHVDCSRVEGFSIGCQVYKSDFKPIDDGVYRLKFFKWVITKDGVIIEISLMKPSI
ncbi:hypothetical protein CEQ90_19980 [Lewinellaceae bacterium SD302]|nr:hypothetical protein CEQ90_19980 [Lewinellaceae bacterium SD302]